MEPKLEEQPLQIVEQGLQPLVFHVDVEHTLFLAAEVTGSWRVREPAQVPVTGHSFVQHSPPRVPDVKGSPPSLRDHHWGPLSLCLFTQGVDD